MTSQLTLTVNGQPYSVEVAPDTPLLYVLRNDLSLNGPQYGCGSHLRILRAVKRAAELLAAEGA